MAIKVPLHSFKHFPRQILVGRYYHSLTVNATYGIKNCLTFDEHVVTIFVRQQVAITTV